MNTDLSMIKSVNEIRELTYQMWQKGWDEANGGNISYILTDDEVAHLEFDENSIREMQMKDIPDNVRGKYFLVTSTGSFFKNIKESYKDLLGIIRVHESKDCYEICMGYESGARPTSELYSHLLSHSSRLKVNPNHRVIMHNHATNILSMTFIHELDENKFTLSLWRMITECLVLFPDGIGLLPWMVCCNQEIGISTAKKMEEHRIVIWPYHGVLTAGDSMDDAFGLLETVDKAAQIYVNTAGNRCNPGISNEGLKEIARDFNLKVRYGVIE